MINFYSKGTFTNIFSNPVPSFNFSCRMLVVSSLPFLAFLAGQQTNSTPLNTSMPHGSNMANDLSFMLLSPQALEAVEFHWSKFQHFVWLWMWSKRQCSGTNRASDWNGPSTMLVKLVKDINDPSVMMPVRKLHYKKGPPRYC